MHRFWILAAALLGMTGVGMAAYIAHGLGFITDPAELLATQQTLHSAMLMQMLHALALLGVGLWARQGGNLLLGLAGLCFLAGTLVFCGLIYLRIFADVQHLRQFVPWGGTSLMLGWLLLGVAGLFTPCSRIR